MRKLSEKDAIRIGIVLVLFMTFALFFFLPLTFKARRSHPFTVRVRVAHDAGKLKLGAGSPCEIRNARTNELLEKKISLFYPVEITASGVDIKVGDKLFRSDRIRVSSGNGDDLELNGTVYRGNMDIIRKNGLLDAVNNVDLEDYLKGVLPCEVYHFWPFSALKAQAVASRSFAVYQALRRRNKEYDLTDDTFSQVYRGKSSERWRTSRAVDVTGGEVLEYKGKVFPGYFHSCCGGHTEDIERVWKNTTLPLKGVRCIWCRWSPRFRWRARVPTRNIVKRFNEENYAIKRVDDIRTGPRDPSGHPEHVAVRADNKWFEMGVEDFRSIVGRQYLKSSNFRVKKYPRFYLFTGHGWGHGVGMCQWGAFGQSIRGRNTEMILKYYYPEARIARLREILI